MTSENLAELFIKYNRKCFGLCISFGLSPEDAEDIVQDVFISLSKFEDHYPARLIFLITQHKCIDFVKVKNNNNKKHTTFYEDKNWIAAIEIKSGLIEHLYNEIESLKGQQKKVAKLLVYGFSQKEIAEMLHLKQPTLATHVLRIRQKLKPSIDNYF